MAELYADPVFTEQPLGIADMVRDGFSEDGGPSGQEPYGSRTYRISGDPQTVIDGYSKLAQAEG